MRKVNVIIERGADGSFSAYMDGENLPYGLIGEGQTVQETKEDFMVAYDDMRTCCAERKEQFVELEFNFKYDVASFLQFYAFAFTLAGLERITGVNQKQLSHYINGVKKPRPETIVKIETSLHRFGQEIGQVKFV